VISQYSSVGTK